MKRALVALFGVVLSLAALAGVVVVGLGQSEAGTRFLAEQAQRLLPLRLVGVSGTLGGGVRVEQLTLALERHEVVVEDLSVELGLLPLLFDNRLVAHDLRARSARLVELRPADPAAPSAPLALPFLPIELGLERVELERLELPGVPPIAVRGSANWSASSLEIRDLSVTGETIRVALVGVLGAGADPTLEVTLEWSLPQAGWSGTGQLSGPVDELRVAAAVTGQYGFDLQGSLDLALPARPGFDLVADVHDVEAEAYAVAGISARITGTLDALVVESVGRIDARRGEPFPLRLNVRGPVKGPLAVDIRSEPLGGDLRAAGMVDWTDGLAVTAQGSVRDLDLAPVLEGHQGRLGADLGVEFGSAGIAVALTNLSGKIDQRPISGQAQFRGGIASDWTVEAAELAIGDNRVQLQGHWDGVVLGVDGRIAAPALEQLGLGLAGSVEAEVDLAGQWPALEGSVAVDRATLVAAGGELRELAGLITLTGGKLSGELRADRLDRAPVVLERPTLALSGALELVDWRLNWKTGESRGRLRRSADELGLDVDVLRFGFRDLAFAIDAPTALRFRGNGVEATPVCFSAGDARACLARFDFEDGRIATAGQLERLPLALLQEFLPVAFQEAGFVEGGWDLRGSGDAWTGSIRLAARRLGFALAEVDQERFELPDVQLDGAFAGSALDLTVLAANDEYRIEGTARLEPVALDGQLAGSIVFSMSEFDWLADLDSRIADLGGAITAQLAISGTAGAPVVQGELELRDGRVALEDPEIRLDELRLTARVDPRGAFEFDGRGIQKDGKVELDGRGSGLFGGEFELDAALRGDRLRATHPQWEVTVAPDLGLAVREGIARVTGTIELPRADVRLKSLPTSVPRPSADVIVVGREAPAADRRSNRLRMNVQIRLGREVRLQALGVEARLQGDLRVRRDARGQASARGTLDVTGGIISAQGQTLTIESGVVVYNGPIDKPYIDVRAVREIEDQSPPVKVGLRIEGSADSLRSTIFSEPAMAENRALAFLVLGRDIEAQSDADSNALLGAAISLGLNQSKSLIGELQRASGLDELSAYSAGQDNYAIAAGKRIGKDTLLRYTYNTLTAVGSVLLSVDLTERWRLEALSGESSSMDILYRIDR